MTKKHPPSRPDIFIYRDFRQYLSDMFSFVNSGDETFTKAHICRRLGLPNSRSYFGDIIAGKYLSPAKVPAFCELFGLSKDESQYFRVLVNFNQVLDNPEEQDVLLGRLLQMKSPGQDSIVQSQYDYYRNPRNAIVRAMLDIVDATADDIEDLTKALGHIASDAQVRESLDILIQLELVTADKKGFLKPRGNAITSGLSDDDIIRIYQLKLLEMSRIALTKKSDDHHNLITKIVTVSDEGVVKLQKAVENFRQEITSIVCADKKRADHVYHMLIACHPFAHHTKESSC